VVITAVLYLLYCLILTTPSSRRLKGYRHILDPWTTVKFQFPNFYRKPGLGYQKLAQHRHKDIFDREWTGDYDDRYISTWDGRVSKLVVQAVDEIYDNNVTATYRRTFIRNIAPLYMRLANWPFNHVDYSKTGKPTSEGNLRCRFPSHFLMWTRLSHALSQMVRCFVSHHYCGKSTVIPIITFCTYLS
jgi:hypothetical protein